MSNSEAHTEAIYTTTDTRNLIFDLLGRAAHGDCVFETWPLATEALALATAAGYDLLIEEAEGLRDRADHDINCKWCRGKLDPGTPPESFWCTNSH